MKFQLLAFIFPTLACVHFLLAASWFLFALFGPLIFVFKLSVQLLTIFTHNLRRFVSAILSLFCCATLECSFRNLSFNVVIACSVFLCCKPLDVFLYRRLAQASICAIAIDHRVVF